MQIAHKNPPIIKYLEFGKYMLNHSIKPISMLESYYNYMEAHSFYDI